MLEEFLEANAELFKDDYIVVKLDYSQGMKRVATVARALGWEGARGVPWMAILDADGKELITSDGPNGNIGYPIAPPEIQHFVTMIETTSQKAPPANISAIARALAKNAARYRGK
ncbi:MAG: hypothetical protein A2W31_01945 [Planctomycetes bacterium RBG_16_64_10]|nr:MAG: hypothetical protein A2W31_01945 [Planctomycetes bacterium RBG_16_64_10]